MPGPIKRLLAAAAAALLLAAAPSPAQDERIAFFEKKIRPALEKHCLACHSAKLEQPMGGLRLDSRQAVLRGGANGPALVPGNPQKSLILKALNYNDPTLKMPPAGKLPDRAIDDFRRWIAQGASDPRAAQTQQRTPKPDGPGTPIEEGRRWWAFQPLRQRPAPPTERLGWSRRKIDAFILAKLEKNRLQPSPQADPRTLIRRASFDLTGLKPTYQQVEAFAADQSPNAYPMLIERLLASPRYGERWARHWLDTARWGEDHPTSESTNQPHPYAWRYRDWVIEAVNADIPYDRFIRMQFAADLLPDFQPADMRALGYIGNAPLYHKDPRLSRDVIETIASDDWDERVDAVSRGLLGLTVACARCHDHKFDPITNKDYYALAGVFASIWPVKRPIVAMNPAAARKLVWNHERLVRRKGQLGNLKELDTIAPELHPLIAELRKKTNALDLKLAADQTPLTHAVIDCGVWIDGGTPTVTWFDLRPGRARDLPLFIRGNAANPGEIVPRRFLSVLSKGEPQPFRNGSGRLELADKIVGEAAPLAARVWVNRVWGWHFGGHLVRTPSDFGAQGQAPTHPRLLDDLAARFVENGWSLKWLHREIMLSAAYRQSGRRREAAFKSDPANRLLWRFTPRRLDIESWRDAILQASGELVLTMGGPSTDIERETAARRTVYTRISRSKTHPILTLYDFPDANQHAPQRRPTTTPLQQLFLLNSRWMRKQASSLAAKVAGVPGTAEKIRALYRRTLNRSPSAQEIDLAARFVRRSRGDSGGADSNRADSDRDAWAELAQVLLGANEFIFLN